MSPYVVVEFFEIGALDAIGFCIFSKTVLVNELAMLLAEDL